MMRNKITDMTTVRTAVHNRATTNRPGGGPRVRLIRAVEWIRSVLRTTTTSLVPGNVALMELAHGNWVTATLYVAAKLNIADELAGGPLGAEEIARRVGADPDAIRRIMRALASKAVFKQTNDGRFALTPVGQALRSDTHGSMRDFILFIGCAEHWELWGSLLHSVRAGKPATDELRGMPFFSYLDTNPRYAEVFNNAMTRFSELSVDAVANGYDFTQFSVVADVGGGHGRLLATILAAAHDSRGILYDLPSVVDGAGPTLEAAGVRRKMHPRWRLVLRCRARGRRRLRDEVDRPRLGRRGHATHPAQYPRGDRIGRHAAARGVRVARTPLGACRVDVRRGNARQSRRPGAHPRRFRAPAVAGRLPRVAGDRHREPVVDRRGLADLAISLQVASSA